MLSFIEMFHYWLCFLQVLRFYIPLYYFFGENLVSVYEHNYFVTDSVLQSCHKSNCMKFDWRQSISIQLILLRNFSTCVWLSVRLYDYDCK